MSSYAYSLLRHLCDVAHLLWRHKRSAVLAKARQKVVVTANPPVHCQMPPQKRSLSAISSKAKGRKLSLRQEKDNEATSQLDSQRQRSARRRIAKATTKIPSPVNERVNDEHRCLSQHVLST